MGLETLDFRPSLIAWAEVQAETLGAKRCRKEGVGAVLRKLRAHLDSGATEMLGPHTRRTVQLLESNCRICGLCALEQIMPRH